MISDLRPLEHKRIVHSCCDKPPSLGQPQETNAVKNYNIEKIPLEEKCGMEGRVDVVRHEVIKKSCILRIRED